MALNLKEFDSSMQGTKPSQAAITFYPSGRIALSQKAMEETGYKIGDKISIFQDKDDPADWYIGKSETGIPLSEAKKGETIISAKAIAKAFMESVEQETCCRFSISLSEHKADKKPLWAIFTRKPLTVRAPREEK